MITADRLREILHYDLITGVFTWREKISHKVVVGRRAGCENAGGYRTITLFGRTYYEHRLAHLYVTGEWPPALIDHENLNKSDNRWENLRPATKSQNAANSARSTVNATGYKGVSWHEGAQKYQAHIAKDGRSIYLGLFDDPALAHEAYKTAANDNFQTFARAS